MRHHRIDWGDLGRRLFLTALGVLAVAFMAAFVVAMWRVVLS